MQKTQPPPKFTECPNCKGANLPGKKYCGECGTAIDPLVGTVEAYFNANLRAQLDTVIRERFRDRELTEISLASTVLERLSGWAKLLGFALGLPLAALGTYLGFVGWDFRNSMKKIETQAQTNKQLIEATTTEIGEVTKRLKLSRDEAAGVDRELVMLHDKVRQATRDLQALPSIEQNVNALNEKVRDLRSGTGGASVLQQMKREGKPLGIDVSRFNGALDWAKLKAAGVSFVFIKATQGTSPPDPSFWSNWQSAKQAGLIRGAYHFLTGADPTEQGKLFADTLHQEVGDLPPVIDFEANPRGPSPTLSGLKVFAKSIEQRTGCTPIVYTGSYVGSLLGTEKMEDLGRYPLWIAQFGRAPVVPPAWQTWTFWQFSDGLVINDLPALEFNVFNGSRSQLQDFARRTCTARGPH